MDEPAETRISPALYAYMVRRKFPSAEVLRNKQAEMDGVETLPPFADEPFETRVLLTVFRLVAEALEPYAETPIEDFNPDGAPSPDLAAARDYHDAVLLQEPVDAGEQPAESATQASALSTATPADATAPTDGAANGTASPSGEPQADATTPALKSKK